MDREKLEIIFNLNCLSAIDAWNLIHQRLTETGRKNAEASVYGKSMNLNKISMYIVKSNRKSFLIETDEMSFHFTAIANYKQILIVIEGKDIEHLQWDDWVRDFVGLDGFVQAWVSDVEYSYWQNAFDPVQFLGSGRSYEGLPMISNDLPYPLERMNVDISANPLRRLIKVGYVAAIGSPMWLGDSFWQYCASEKNLLVEKLGDNIAMVDSVIKIDYVEGGFKDESTLAQQFEMRQLLFGT